MPNVPGRPPELPQKILHALLAHGPHADIAQVTVSSARRYLGGPTNTAKPLRASRFVVHEDGEDGEDGKGGFRLGPGLGLVLSFSVGGEHLICGLVDAGGKAHCVRRDDPTRRQLTAEPAELLARIAALAREVLEAGLEEDSGLAVPTANSEPALRLIGATVSWPAPMDHASRLSGGPIAAAWSQKTFREHLSGALGLPLDRCHAINDANAGALTMAFEQREPRAGAVLCLHLSAGIGLGTVHQAIPQSGRLAFVDAHLVGGHDNQAGEIGHCVLEPGVVAALNAATAQRRDRPHFAKLKSLDPERVCDCGPDSVGHLEAVVGAEALLARLGRFDNGDSLVQRLDEIHAEAETDSVIQFVLRDVGRAVGSTLSGMIAATDPVSVTLVGALASDHIAAGMNERFRANDVPERAVLYDGSDRELVGLRGAALAVLRGALYRGFFNRIEKRPGLGEPAFPEDWHGWDRAPDGAQSGKTDQKDSAWEYRPLIVGSPFDWRAI